MLYKWNNKTRMKTHLITYLLNILSPLLSPTVQKKKIPSKLFLSIDNAPGLRRALTEMYKAIHVVFMPANTTFILQSMDERVIRNLTF